MSDLPAEEQTAASKEPPRSEQDQPQSGVVESQPAPSATGVDDVAGSSSTGGKNDDLYRKIYTGEARPKGDDGTPWENFLTSIFSNPRSPSDFPVPNFISESWGFVQDAFPKTRCAVIYGKEVEACVPFAYRLASRETSVIYHTKSVQIGPLATKDLVNHLVSDAITQPTCLIIEWPWGSDKSFNGQFLKFVEAVRILTREEQENRDRFLVVCIHSLAVKARIDAGNWEEGITIFECPDGLDGRTQKESTAVRSRTVMEGLSEGKPSGLAAVREREREAFIPSLMARIAVLFPNLTSSNFERLLERAMGARNIELTAATKEQEADSASAVSLWRFDKPYFEEQAGLERYTDITGVQRVRFRSPELEELALTWGWSNPEELFTLFTVASGMNVLFGDLSDDEQQDMFDTYMAAAVQLARRSPGHFGARWLETLARDYAAWVKSQLHDFNGANLDIFALLGHVVNSIEERRLWRHFARRMGVLLNQLFRDEAAPLVVQFVDRLFRQGLHELALRIVLEIGEARETRTLEWLRAIMHQGDAKARAAVIREIALEVSWDASRAAPFVQEMVGWTHSRNDSVRRAVLAFPAVLVDIVSRKSFEANDDTTPLSKTFGAPCVNDATVRELCTSLAMDAEFGTSAAEQLAPDNLSEEVAASFVIALMLYQIVSSLPAASKEDALAFSRAMLKPMKHSTRGSVRQHWQAFADHLMAVKRRLNAGTASDRARRINELDRRYSLCKSLIRA